MFQKRAQSLKSQPSSTHTREPTQQVPRTYTNAQSARCRYRRSITRARIGARARIHNRRSPSAAAPERSSRRVACAHALPEQPMHGQCICGPHSAAASHPAARHFHRKLMTAHERASAAPRMLASRHKLRAASHSTTAASPAGLGRSTRRRSICRAMPEAEKRSREEPGEHS